MGLKYLIRKLRGTTILLVEDSQMQGELTRTRLESLGYRVIWCLSASEALEQASRSRVDCNVVDWVTGESIEFRVKAIRGLVRIAPTIIWTVDLAGLKKDAPEFASFAFSKEIPQSDLIQLVEDRVRNRKKWAFKLPEFSQVDNGNSVEID